LSRSGRRSLYLFWISFALLLILVGSTNSTLSLADDSDQPSGFALHIFTPTERDYGYLSRNITAIEVVDGREYLFQVWVKVRSFTPYPAGVIFQANLIGMDGQLRFSIRLTNDLGVLFYYPYGPSSAVYTARKAWVAGSWYNYTVRMKGSTASFYVNGSLAGTSEDLGLDAAGGGFKISSLARLGEPDDRNMAFEGFIDNVMILEDGAVKFAEGFEGGLENYIISKSEGAVVETVAVAGYTTLWMIVQPTLVRAGEETKLVGWLRDSSNFGIANRTVIIKYLAEGGSWINLTSVKIFSNGSFTYMWKVPMGMRGQLSLRAEFLGDEFYQASVSESALLTIRPPAAVGLDSRLVLILVAVGVISVLTVFRRRLRPQRVLSYSFLLACAVNSFFAFIITVNRLELFFCIAYKPQTVKLTVFSGFEDWLVWLGSLLFIIAAPCLLHLTKHARPPRSFYISYGIFPFAAILHISGLENLAAQVGLFGGLFILLASIVSSRRVLSMPRLEALTAFMAGLLAILLPIEAGSASAWAYNAFDPHYPFDGEPRWVLPLLEMHLFNVAYSFTAWLLLAGLFSWIWSPPINWIYTRVTRLRAPSTQVRSSSSTVEHSTKKSGLRHDRRLWLSLLSVAVSIALGAFITYYPYFYQPRLLGVDAPDYYRRLLAMKDPSSALALMTTDPKASYMLLLYLAKATTGWPAEFVVKITPALPAAFLAVATYLFVKVGTDDAVLAGLASLFATFSIHTTVAMFAGIFGNWLAIAWVMLLFATLLKSLKTNSKRWLLASSAFSFLVLATHVWTWAIVMAALLAYVILSIRVKRTRLRLSLSWRSKDFLFSLTVFLFSVGLVAAMLLGLPFIGGLVGIRGAALSGTSILESMGVHNLSEIQGTLRDTLTFYVGGFNATPLAYLFAAGALLGVSLHEHGFRRLLASFLIAASLPLVLVDPSYQWRMLYIVPFEALLALGVYKIGRLPTMIDKGSKIAMLFNILIVLVVVLASFNYAVRSLSFMEILSPASWQPR